MLDPNSPEFERNLGFYSIDEQAKLNESTVAIAGAGGDGGMLAIQLARLGVGHMRLADPDPFEAQNINRQAACTTETVGVNKAVAVGRYIQEINPNITIELFEEGVQEHNVEQFVEGSDLVIDETEFTIHAIGVMLARASRKHGVSNLMAMNIGFGTTVTAFHPEKGMTFEKMLGLSETASIDEISKAEPEMSGWLPYIPPYADLEVFKKVVSGEKSAPSVAPGVAIAASVAATQATLHLVGRDNNRPDPIYAPNVLMMDAMTGTSKIMKLGKRAHTVSALKMLVNNKLGRVPKASY